jgi:hypothetical protein
MRTLRFGRKLSLPSTIAIKHQVRMLMAQYEATQAEAKARAQAFRGQPSLAVPSVTLASRSSGVNMDATEGTPRWDSQNLVVGDGPHNSSVHKQTCHGRLG